jgi:feruloyl esterase
MTKHFWVVVLLLCFFCLVPPAFGETACDHLKSLSLRDTTITEAELVPAGPYKPPAQGPAGSPQPSATMLPAYCRVAAVLKPSLDSNIGVEVWLPAEDWNGKFLAVGGGGWAGMISYPAMVAALQEHYATASTDTGHKGNGGDASFAIGHPEKMVDYGYRAVHEMTIKSKAIITAFYGRNSRLSYWTGCSLGGRQGLMEAQRYPEDFDGIIAGAPANYHIHLVAADMAAGLATLKNKESFLTPAKYALLNQAVLAQCDAQDGVKDGVLTDPRTCRFDPSKLLCPGSDADNCLTAPQIEAAKKIYAPVRTKTGEVIFPGLEPGTELAWGPLTGGPAPLTLIQGAFMVAHDDPNWDWRTFDLESDISRADEKLGFIHAINPDLHGFEARGGKLLLYHGWNDQLIAPQNTINYYSSVLAKMGAKQDNWLRLFMAPGMQHCQGGPGPDQINFLGALERWRESGVAPDQIMASRVTNNRVAMTRPLCPYPQVAQYRGVGSTNDAANFVCKAP